MRLELHDSKSCTVDNIQGKYAGCRWLDDTPIHVVTFDNGETYRVFKELCVLDEKKRVYQVEEM